MKHSAWKWLFGISLTVLILLILFTICIWALGNATGALAFAMMSYTDSDSFTFNGIAFGKFLSNFIGSPMFYAYIVDITVLMASFVATIVTRKE